MILQERERVIVVDAHKNVTICPQCGNQVLPEDIRCSRCNMLLLLPCGGNCSRCKRKECKK